MFRTTSTHTKVIQQKAFLLTVGLLFFILCGWILSCWQALGATETVSASFESHSKQFNSETLALLPMLDNGRVKPFDTFARETLRFLTGTTSIGKNSSTASYLGLMTFQSSNQLEVIEIKNPELRKKLELSSNDKAQKKFSLDQIETSSLATLVQPLIENLSSQKITERELNPIDRSALELSRKVKLFQSLRTGEHFNLSLIAPPISPDASGAAGSHSTVFKNLKEYLGNPSEQAAERLVANALETGQSIEPRTGIHVDLSTLQLEVWYNKMRLFLLAAILLVITGITTLSLGYKKITLKKFSALLLALPALSLIFTGFFIRVKILGFSPVTNMYGTMLWVATGVLIFNLVLYFFYSDMVLNGVLTLVASALVALTENVPHILSPDMDPITAVLRSNLWLTIHVLTVTVSYAAFSIAMVLGNTILVKVLANADTLTDSLVKRYAHYAYRMIQLGVLLLSAGIILGGVWADYSWGRFWGWDPKETWALIADIGFIAILHARYIGWLKDLGVLIASTVSYLLVVMAWYGVNFVLATGLHSYGFSSGGFSMILGYLFVQVALWFALYAKWKWKQPKAF